MPDQFKIGINYKNEDKEFPVTIVRLSYSYQLHVNVNEESLVFEPDENREFRWIKMSRQKEDKIKKLNAELIQFIIETLNKIYTGI